MLGRTEWTPKSITKDQQSGFYSSGGMLKIMCFNCGGLGHGIKECKLPINQEHIDIRKNLIFKNGRKSGKNNSGNNNNNDNPGDGSDKNNNNNNKKHGGGNKNNALTIPPKSGEATEKTINGTKLFWCTKCAKWIDHKTDAHPNSDSGNPQGNLAQDNDYDLVGDDSGNQEAGRYAEATGFLSSSSIHF